ncbi:MAG: flagellar hook capping FlgD N-terminal domain-containing protein [Erythrobacter sp.]
MDTTITPTAQAALDQLNAPSVLSSQNSAATLDQGDFLRLLTVQLTQQDPLEPADNEEMLAQMAQFSSLAAATASSDSLASISAKLDDLILAQEAAVEAATSAAQAAASAAAAATAIANGGAAQPVSTLT